MLLNHALLALLWIVYAVLHSLLAHDLVKQKMEELLGSRFRYYRLFYNIFAFVFLVLIIWYGLSIETIQLFNAGWIMRWAGGLAALAGLVLMIVCIRRYFPYFVGLKNQKAAPAQNILIVSGVHRYVRHPLYLGTIVFVWGLAIAFPHLNIFLSTVILTVYILIGIELEESKLVKEFGEAYLSYRKQVPRLIPRFIN